MYELLHFVNIELVRRVFTHTSHPSITHLIVKFIYEVCLSYI